MPSLRALDSAACALLGMVGMDPCSVGRLFRWISTRFGIRYSVFGFRLSPFRFPGLGPTHGAVAGLRLVRGDLLYSICFLSACLPTTTTARTGSAPQETCYSAVSKTPHTPSHSLLSATTTTTNYQ